AAIDLRHHHAGDRRRPAEGAESARVGGKLRRVQRGGRPAAPGVAPKEGRERGAPNNQGGSGGNSIEDLIAEEDMAITVTHTGYIKRTAISTYRNQRRGGKGRIGMRTRDEAFVSHLFVASP